METRGKELCDFIEKTIKDYVANSPNNRFFTSPDEPIWDEPIVGFANGDDPIFAEIKKLIGDFHLTPREALEKYIDSTGWGDKNNLPHVSVIAWALPMTRNTRSISRKETEVLSVQWNKTRVQGQEFIYRMARHLSTMLEGMGHIALCPELASWWEVVKTPAGLSSKWSHRHAAYAAGLGTFSLSDGFITPKGISIRVGTVVCNLELPPTPRKYTGPYGNCLFYTKGTCKKCIERCPAHAISEKGHDKNKCSDYLHSMRERLRGMGREKDYGPKIMGCGLCQTRVPCEERIPLASEG